MLSLECVRLKPTPRLLLTFALLESEDAQAAVESALLAPHQIFNHN